MPKLPPRTVIFFGGLLTLFGIAAIFSVSIYESFNVTLRQSTVDIQEVILYKGQFDAWVSGEVSIYANDKSLGPDFKQAVNGIVKQYKTLRKLFGALELTTQQKKDLTILQHLYNNSFSGLALSSLSVIPLELLLSQQVFITSLNVFVTKYSQDIMSLQYDLGPSNYFYFSKQIKNIIYALIIGIIVFFIPIRLYKNYTLITIIAVVVFILQLCVFVPGLGAKYNGALGWIDIPGLPSIQPVEFFKLGYVIFIARWYIRKQKMMKNLHFWIYFIIFHIIIFGVFLLIPDFGSILVMGITSLVVARYAGAQSKHIFVLVVGGALAGGLAVLLLVGLFPTKFSYLAKRFDYFANNEKIDTQDVNRGIGRQNYQALLAIGGGGFAGQGYGKGLQKFGYIPEAQSDFIFAAFSEEVGFLGNFILLILYAGLAYTFLSGIMGYRDTHLKFIGIGILALIFIQMFVNIGVNTRILPNTGLTLPFISYGGTAIMVNIIEIVILFKIIQTARNEEFGIKK